MNTNSDVQTILRLDEPAPQFSGRSTHGPIKLADYAGKWLVFFAHPADFTPVCASEFVSFARHAKDFSRLNCSLLGLSVDSVYAHLAWRESIREKFYIDIDFPIVEDISLEIARAYGMVQGGGGRLSAVRALFVIDPEGMLRAMLYYPVTTGRSVAEVLRLVEALQTSDRLHVVTPEGWQPGKDVVDPPPVTVAGADARRGVAFGCVDWYYYARPVDASVAGSGAK